MTPLLQFIHKRRADIEGQIRDLRDELEELGAVEAALRARANGQARPRQPGQTSAMPMRDMVLDVLRDRPEGAEKRAIAERIREKHGASVALNSLTTELSRMKVRGTLGLEGKVWRLAH